MKKSIWLCVVLCALQVSVQAQNWNLVPSDEPMFFRDRLGKVSTVQVRQSLKVDSDSILYFYAAAADSEHENEILDGKYPRTDSTTYIFYEPTFLGAELLMRPNGEHLLIDTGGKDTFLIKAGALLNESWQFGPKAVHKAEVVDTYYGNKYGVTDSFKTLLLNLDTTSKTLTLSKAHGVVASGVHLFPGNKSGIRTYEKIADPRLTFRQLNDFEVGDIFHSYYSRDALYGGKYIDTILEKSFSTDSSKVYYKVKRLRELNNYYPEVTTLHHETVNWELNYREEYILKGYPGILYPNSGGPSNLTYYTAYDSNSSYKTGYMKHFREIVWSPNTRTYFAGAGSYYYYNPESENGSTHQTLSYYKKSNREWGTKLVVSRPTLPELQQISIYPNPAHNLLQVNGLEEAQAARILDVSGKVYQNVQLHNGHLDISTLAPGSYLLALDNGQNIFFSVL